MILALVFLTLTSVQGQSPESESGEAAAGESSDGAKLSRLKELMKASGLGASAEAGPGDTATNSSKVSIPDSVNLDCSGYASSEIGEACTEAVLSYYETYSEGMKHRTAVLNWQYRSAIVIFIIVLAIVAVGVYFAYIQFRMDIVRSRASQGTGDDARSELELSTSGIKVSSPVLGVIILAISIAFLYLYLVHVYPISEIK